jgi:hypothetical protein
MKTFAIKFSFSFLLLIVLTLNSYQVKSQSKPGMYLTMDLDMELCDHKVKLLNAEEIYCLSEEPIIELDLFEKVDELVYDSLFEMRKFRIVLTTQGSNYVNTVASKLPGHQLGLVVNGILVSVIDLDGIYSARSIMIWDKNDSQAMEWLHQSLVRSVEKSYKKS